MEVEFSLIPMARPEKSEKEEQKPAVKGGPKSVQDGVDWNKLQDKVGATIDLSRYQLACFLDNLVRTYIGLGCFLLWALAQYRSCGGCDSVRL